jgi:hypothetical protein
MQEFVASLVQETGLDQTKVENGIGIFLGLIRSQGGDQAAVSEILAKIPGAETLLAQHSTGLMGQMLGGMMGGPLVAISKLNGAGINNENAKIMATRLIAHAKQHAGEALVRRAASNIPGLGGYL